MDNYIFTNTREGVKSFDSSATSSSARINFLFVRFFYSKYERI